MSPLSAVLPDMGEAQEQESWAWSEAERQEELAGLSSDDRAFLRDAAKNSLYILSKGVLGYPDVTPLAHKELCEEVCADRKKRRLFLMPRAHLKSTLVTIADSIRLVLRNPQHERILIGSETATQAQKFLLEIKQHWEKNELLRTLFPELVPERLTGAGSDWSAARATLRRETGHREAHWTAIGVGGAITGGHFTRIKPDDLIGLEAYRSPAKMQETIQWNNSIEPLLVNQNKDLIDWVGTRWAPNDLYAHIMEFYGDDLAVYTRTAIEDGRIIFPELHSWEEYRRLQEKNPHLWYAQYENNPISGGPTDLPIEAIRSYYITPDSQEVSFRTEDGSEKRWKVRDLDRAMVVDPNSGSPVAPDMAAILCGGMSPDEECFTLEAYSDRADPHAFVNKIMEMARRWKPRVIGIEKAGQQNTQFYFEKLMREEREYFRVEEVKPGRRSKEERIRYNLQPIVVSGKLHVLASQSVLRQQIKDFPNNLLIDELDCLGYLPELLRKPRVSEEKHRSRQKALRLVMQTRNPRTGY